MRTYAKEHVGLTRAVFELYRGVFSCFVVMQASALSVGQRLLFIAETKEQCNKKEVRIMTQNNNSWRKTYFTLLAGQAISFISSGILQMAIIFYLVAKTNSAIILTAATLIGFCRKPV